MKENIKNWFGFGEQPAKWWAWAAVIALLLFAVIFYLSFALAKRNKMLNHYRAKTLEYKTQWANEKKRTQIAVLEERNKHLDKTKKAALENDKKHQATIRKARAAIAKGEKEVKRQQAKTKGLSLAALFKQHDTLKAETIP